MPPQCQIMDAPPAPSTTTAIGRGAGGRGGRGRGGRGAGGTSSAPPSSLPSKNTSCDGDGDDDDVGPSSPLLRMASMELEVLRSSSTGPVAAAPGAVLSPAASAENLRPFPPACRRLLYEIPGNSRCVDCGELGPDWASVSYGALLCLRCSGHHRNLGVKTSFVRSVSMDHWSHSQILCMLEGGNHQLSQFFARHRLPPSPGGGRSASASASAGAGDANGSGSGNGNSGTHRYRTVAARFYREKLAEHAGDVGGRGEYRGREAARSGRRRRSDGGDGGGGGSSPSSPARPEGAAAENNVPLRMRGGEETARPAGEKSSLRRRRTSLSPPPPPSSAAEHDATAAAAAAERRRKERNAVRRSMTA